MTELSDRPSLESALQVRDVEKGFSGLKAVNGVSLDVTAGAITALIGPNGAGKTSLFNVMTGFDRADAGSIKLFGTSIEKQPAWRIARLGMVRSFQTPVGFPSLSVWENLLVAGSSAIENLGSTLLGKRSWLASEKEVAARAEATLDKLGLSDQRDAVLEDLSGGEVKLVDFGRQMMIRPRLLLLDEPAAGVHPSGIEKLGAEVRQLRDNGITVVVIDHNISFVFAVADYIYVLANGAVVAHGLPDAIAKDPSVIELYLGSGA